MVGREAELDAVRAAAAVVAAGTSRVVVVVGDRTSSNSHRLREAAAATGVPAYLIETAAGLQDAWLAEARVVGVSAGASTPDDLVSEVVARLCRDGATVHEAAFLQERIAFRLPVLRPLMAR